MAATPSIKVKYHISPLDDAQNKLVEKAGILALAGEFIGHKSVGKADEILKICKIYLQLYLSQTKSGGYIGINPNIETGVKIPITRLVQRQELKEFLEEEGNLDLNKIHKKLMSFTVEQKNLTGAMSKDMLSVLKSVLALPREDDNRAKPIPTLRTLQDVKREMNEVNSLIYDDNTLNQEVAALLKMVEDALKKREAEAKKKLDEVKKEWKDKLKLLETEEKKKLTEREKQLKKDKEAADKEAEKERKKKLNLLLKGITKNMKKDAAQLVSIIENFEAELQNIGANPHEFLLKKIQLIEDEGSSFMAAVGLARDNVMRAKSEEGDIEHFARIKKEDLDKEYERDVVEIQQALINAREESEAEIAIAQSELDQVSKLVNQFADQKSQWEAEIKSGISVDSSLMIPEDAVNIDGGASFAKLLIPFYIIIMKNKKGQIFNLVIPPLRLPPNLSKIKKKNKFTGRNKNMIYYPIDDGLFKLANWLATAMDEVADIKNAINDLPNIAADKTENHRTFTEAKEIFVNQLMMKPKVFEKIVSASSPLIV